MTDIDLNKLPQSLLPIRVDDWKSACEWIVLGGGELIGTMTQYYLKTQDTG